MNTSNKTARIIEDVQIKLSALWAARMLSGFLGDVLRASDSVLLKQIIAGETAIPVTREFLFVIAIILVIPIVMVFLSLTLEYKANRWANIILGIFFVGFDLFFLISVLGPLESPAYDIFLAFVYPVFTGLVVWHAWKWPKQEA